MFCAKCGNELADDARFCLKCGAPVYNSDDAAEVEIVEARVIPETPAQTAQSAQSSAPVQNVTVVNHVVSKKNGIGTAGFVLALLGLILCWVPVLSWLLWVLGALFSLIGIFKSPRGLAVAGLVISFIDIILLLVVIAGCAAAGTGMLIFH